MVGDARRYVARQKSGRRHANLFPESSGRLLPYVEEGLALETLADDSIRVPGLVLLGLENKRFRYPQF